MHFVQKKQSTSDAHPSYKRGVRLKGCSLSIAFSRNIIRVSKMLELLQRQPIMGQVDRASVTETVLTSWFDSRLGKPKTVKIDIDSSPAGRTFSNQRTASSLHRVR